MQLPKVLVHFREYLRFSRNYFRRRFFRAFFRFEKSKGAIVDTLYRRRGRYAQPFVHTGMVGMLFTMVTLGPLVLTSDVFSSDLSQGTLPSAVVLGVSDGEYSEAIGTLSSDEVKRYRGGEVIEYEVAEGDTVSSVAEKFNVSQDTVLWANSLTEKSKIKAGDKLKILPVTGVLHKVKKGETVYTVAKKYGLDGDSGAQAIVDYPFNAFVDDESFALAVGQDLVIPGGVVPDVRPVSPSSYMASVTTPDAGAVSATGGFVWPAAGRITQGYVWYHRAIDIANKSGGPVLAADSGLVVVASWLDNSGYGIRVMIDHGNGFVTLYGHLSRVRVAVGQTVNRGDVIGDMGSTGRSTGVHLHFEIRRGGSLENPLNFLR